MRSIIFTAFLWNVTDDSFLYREGLRAGSKAKKNWTETERLCPISYTWSLSNRSLIKHTHAPADWNGFLYSPIRCCLNYVCRARFIYTWCEHARFWQIRPGSRNNNALLLWKEEWKEIDWSVPACGWCRKTQNYTRSPFLEPMPFQGALRSVLRKIRGQSFMRIGILIFNFDKRGNNCNMEYGLKH